MTMVDLDCEDSWLAVRAAGSHLRRPDVIFVDPDYTDATDWNRVRQLCHPLHEERVPYIVWYPYFGWNQVQALVNDVTACEAWEVRWNTTSKMSGCGLTRSRPFHDYREPPKAQIRALTDAMDFTESSNSSSYELQALS